MTGEPRPTRLRGRLTPCLTTCPDRFDAGSGSVTTLLAGRQSPTTTPLRRVTSGSAWFGRPLCRRSLDQRVIGSSPIRPTSRRAVRDARSKVATLAARSLVAWLTPWPTPYGRPTEANDMRGGVHKTGTAPGFPIDEDIATMRRITALGGLPGHTSPHVLSDRQLRRLRNPVSLSIGDHGSSTDRRRSAARRV